MTNKEYNDKVREILDALLRKYKDTKTSEELMGLVLAFAGLLK